MLWCELTGCATAAFLPIKRGYTRTRGRGQVWEKSNTYIPIDMFVLSKYTRTTWNSDQSWWSFNYYRAKRCSKKRNFMSIYNKELQIFHNLRIVLHYNKNTNISIFFRSSRIISPRRRDTEQHKVKQRKECRLERERTKSLYADVNCLRSSGKNCASEHARIEEKWKQ